MKSLRLLLLICLVLSPLRVRAADAPPDSTARMIAAEKLADGLRPKDGTVSLQGDVATIHLDPQYRYLDPADTETVLAKLWGNPPGHKTLGMIVPKGFSPLRRAWAVVIEYEEDGYVKDDDAATIDYTKLLDTMKKGTHDANEERVKAGYEPIEVVGWATPPRYDAATHKMYWAREIKFGTTAKENTLNYNIRILGRRGILVLNAVAGMRDLPAVEGATPTILAMVNFQDGSKYTDFKPDTDKVATYGLAALVLGGIAAKAGFFKLLLVGILAAKKLVIAGGAALYAFFKKFFKKKKSPFVADAAAPVLPPPAPPPPSDRA